MPYFQMFDLSVRAKAAARRLLALARRYAHYVQAAAYTVGAAVYQVVTAAGGFDAVRGWPWREWAGRLIVSLGPPLLFLLRGKHAAEAPEPIAVAPRAAPDGSDLSAEDKAAVAAMKSEKSKGDSK